MREERREEERRESATFRREMKIETRKIDIHNCDVLSLLSFVLLR